MDLEYLPLVVEEAAEVIQAAMKIQRFGENHKYQTGDHAGKTNMEALAHEIGDLLEVIEKLAMPIELVTAGRKSKRERLEKYSPAAWRSHHSE